MNREYRMLSFVERWAIAPRLHHQNVAEHSYFVALYCSEMCEFMGLSDGDRVKVLDYALRHDAFEAWTSDIPGPAKRSLLSMTTEREYHNQFGQVMGPTYRDAMARGDEQIYNWRSRKDQKGHTFRVRDVIKVADILDSLFFLATEEQLGNRMVEGLFAREMDRLHTALKVFGDWTGSAILATVEKELARLAELGAVIPDNDSDLEGEIPFDEPGASA